MSIVSRRILLIALFFLPISTLATAATGQGGNLARIYPRATLLAGLPEGSSPAIEHTKIAVPIDFRVEPGVAGARPTYDLAVCTEDSASCIPFPSVTPPWQAPNGTKLMIDAPAANERTLVKLVACVAARTNGVLGCGKQLAEDDVEIVTAMRLAVFIESIKVLHSRARSNDTTYAALAALRENQRVPSFNGCATQLAGFQLEPPVHCAGPISVGDLGEGTHRSERVRVGEYRLVPGQRGNLTIGFVTVNYGAPRGVGPVVDMRTIAMVAMLGKLKATIVDEDFATEINDREGWRGCDGPTAAGSVRLYNHSSPDQVQPTLDDLTKANGRHTFSTKVFVVPSQTTCGESSRYQLTLAIERTTWRSF